MFSKSLGNSTRPRFAVIARSVSDDAISPLSRRLLRSARNDENPNFLRSYSEFLQPIEIRKLLVTVNSYHPHGVLEYTHHSSTPLLQYSNCGAKII
jgi:hypothetical protein